MVGIGSVVTRDVPDHALVYGNPATIRGWVNEYGEKLKLVSGSIYSDTDGKQYAVENNTLKPL
jgi:UDP-2-acetamido-3-amino-2,3-dideoxy-glucuronate N-acetyltransferase